MKRQLVTIVFLAMMLIPSIAIAAKGVVVYYKSGCDYYIVETGMGYVLL